MIIDIVYYGLAIFGAYTCFDTIYRYLKDKTNV